MAEPGDKEKLTEEAIQLQKKLSDGSITDAEKNRLEELKVQLKGGGKPEKVKFKVKSDEKADAKPEPKPEPKPKSGEVKEAKVIETPEQYERRSFYSIDDIKKKIDRLDSEGVGNLRDRYAEKYGEDLYVPDLHSENVKEALEDVKPYLDVDDIETEADEKKKVEEEEEADGEKEEEEKDEGPGFFAKLIEKIKAFFKKLFSRKKGRKDKSVVVDEAVVAASNGE